VTIAITIKTGSAIIFAADSKVTTSGLVGFTESGEANWVNQTYDNAYKVACDKEQRIMAMVAGHANVGMLPAADMINAWSCPPITDGEQQEYILDSLLEQMEDESRAYWQGKLPEDQWPGPTVVFASAVPGARSARVWIASVRGGKFHKDEILPNPGIHLEGSYAEVFSLLYGLDFKKGPDVATQMGVEADKFIEAWRMSKTLSPMAACGGPIDLMVLQLFPELRILQFFGKRLHQWNRDRTHPMERFTDLLRRLQALEAKRRLSIQTGEVRVEPADGEPMDDRDEELRRLFQRKLSRREV
jgi:hypothetical protein